MVLTGVAEAAPIGGTVKRARAKAGGKKDADKPKAATGSSKKAAKKKQLEEAGADREEIEELEEASESEVEEQEEEGEDVKKPLKKAVLKYPKKLAKVIHPVCLAAGRDIGVCVLLRRTSHMQLTHGCDGARDTERNTHTHTHTHRERERERERARERKTEIEGHRKRDRERDRERERASNKYR